MQLTHGSLFSGRGGFEIGAAYAGIETIWNCEIDTFLRNKLRRITPHATQYHDVRTVVYPPRANIISAGFPCQDISISNNFRRQGIKGSRSGLWVEVARIVDETKPDYLLLENSPELLKQGFEHVLSDLSGIGYNAEWDCYRACDFGYPHRRKRLYVIAYPDSVRWSSKILQSPGTYELHQEWAPTAAYLSVSAGRLNGFGDIGAIQRDDVFSHFGREIKAFGNAAMPVVTEHLFLCILEDYNRIGNSYKIGIEKNNKLKF